MAGMEETDDSEKTQAVEEDCLFVWHEESKLYFHASTGFYHDPYAGWYYSCSDGLYYTFENGTYVPLTYNKEEKCAVPKCTSSLSSETAQDYSCFPQHSPNDGTTSEPPPSQWIEETLIDLYLSGYNSTEVAPDSLTVSPENEQSYWVQCRGLTDHLDSDELPVYPNGTENQQSDEWDPTIEQKMDVLTDIISSNEEEKWQAQYGQVTQIADEEFPPFSAVDLWDWEMVMETTKKNHVARLIGRLSKRSSKPHPSVSAISGLLKTATVREVHLNLVRVASGIVYRLRSPNIKYLVSLSAYDSSNPTKDWDFPDIFASDHEYGGVLHDQDRSLDWVDHTTSSTTINELPCMDKKKSNSTYRDRAAERRALHGGFGIGPGQKNVLDRNCGSAEPEISEEEALYEATNASFGPGSYARKILQSMGWKNGESLGSSNKGILEPLCPVGNKGYAGLGWNTARGL
ncbi:hypothetical protein KSP39_PZI006801 [Platanthera zijinensis]|uniref:G-patch domain-containing protein n=1 Tax=Platanthera zijinensis TaxID=2320716 RepID=A0AAP0G9L5_9ASPA